MPLRTRLILLLVVLGAAALFVTDAITYSSLKSSLISQTDQGLQQSAVSLNHVVIGAIRGEAPPDACDGIQLNTFARAYEQSPTSTLTAAIQVVCNQNSGYAPNIPAWALTEAFAGNRVVFTSVDQRGQSYRVLVEPGSELNAPFPVVAFGVPLTAVDTTLNHHRTVDLIVSLLVLLALVLATGALVWLGLRPLEKMAQTAGEIAAGDLSRRVEDTDERTEVGQLGAALNAMLTQIERAFRERQASEERLRRFVGDASHELRTPLTSIRGYAELFKNGPIGRPEDLAAALSRIESESARMGGLVDDLLLLARLDQGRPLGHDRVDLAQLAADAVQDAGVVEPARSIRLVSTGPCFVIGDEQRLRQVLSNLIMNAMTYTPAGSPIEVAIHLDRAPVDVTGLPGAPTLPTVGVFGRLSRSARPYGPTDSQGQPVRPLGASDLVVGDRDGAGQENGTAAGGVGASPVTADSSMWQGTRVAVSVIDHGPGIPSEEMPYVFERFWRADQSRQRSSGGTGLG
ncbi:MAG: sensor histidine kinase, partial [Acidimicrobiales bacterium]